MSDDDQPDVKVRRVFSRGRRQDTVSEPPPPQEEQPVVAIEDKDIPLIEDDDDDFLADLKNAVTEEKGSREPPSSPVTEPEAPETFDLEAAMNNPLLQHLGQGTKEPPKKRGGGGGKKKSSDEFGDLFGTPTAILGGKRELLVRIREYKTAFPLELKNFKIKQNANDEELKTAIAEMETIVSCNSVQELTDQMLLSAIRLVEGATSRYERINCEGTADLLSVNPEFRRLAKILALKYRIYSQVPAEWQMLLLVFSTALVANKRNRRAADISGILNQPY